MDSRIDIKEIDLRDLWEVLKSHLIPILVAFPLGMAVFFGYAHLFVKPEYNSTATLYILKQNVSEDYVYSQSDFSFSLNLVDDCTYMVKSHEILDPVIKELGLDMTYRQLYNRISTTNPTKTRFLEVSVKTDAPEKSQAVINLICEKASRNMVDEIGIDQVRVYSPGTLETNPSNSVSFVKYLLVGAAASLCVYGVFVFLFIMDDKIKNAEDVKKYLELSVLAEVPNFEGGSKRAKYKRYYAYSNTAKEGAKKQQ